MKPNRIKWVCATIAASVSLTAPLAAKDSSPAKIACNAESLDSKPGQTWDEAYGWRFNTSTNPDENIRQQENRANREAAYTALVKGQSPWPDWFKPSVSLLPAGTLFQMAMSEGQGNDRPGGFGTFDEVDTLTEVRENLAVLRAWKKDVQRVNTYRVIQILPVHVGPIGPQVDPEACELYFGRFSQFEMLVAPAARNNYIEFVSSEMLDKD